MCSKSDLLERTLGVAHSLFNRNRTTGSSANISFRFGDHVYISRSGSCFGLLSESDFVEVDLEGRYISDGKPSKELPIHLAFYKKNEQYRSVIHTHGPYAALLSCLSNLDPYDAIVSYTPYLKMKIGNVVLVPYATPGSKELFNMVNERIRHGDALLLANHGAVVAGQSPLDAFYQIEELEESARINWMLRNETNVKQIE